MKTYLTKEMAMDIYKLDEKELNGLLRNGLETALLNGEPILLEDDLRDHIAKRIDKEQFKYLEGNPILLSEAASKYRFHIGSLAQWVEQGHIHILSTDGYRVFLNEADCAYARALADIKGTRPGRPLFGRRKRK